MGQRTEYISLKPCHAVIYKGSLKVVFLHSQRKSEKVVIKY